MDHTKLIILDFGHGGYDSTTGIYHTSETAWRRHFHGGLDLHDGGWFYEGHFNRVLGAEIAARLFAHAIPFLTTSTTGHPMHDVPLAERAARANAAVSNPRNALFISIHANAWQDGDARGWEAHSSGSFLGVRWANAIAEQVGDRLGHLIRMRDNKVSRFAVLTQTKMPAVLTENLYFDQRQDVQLLCDREMIGLLADAHAAACWEFVMGSPLMCPF